MGSYLKTRENREYRISGNGRVECNDHQSSKDFWREVAVPPYGRKIVDLRESRLGANCECKCDDGRWYEFSGMGGLQLTDEEKRKDSENKKNSGEKQKSKKGKNNSTANSETEQYDAEAEQRMEAERAAREAAEAATEKALSDMLFGRDYEELSYPEKVRRIIKAMFIHEGVSQYYRKAHNKLWSIIEGDFFEVRFTDWVDSYKNEKTLRTSSGEEISVFLSRMAADFVEKFPSFDGKYPELDYNKIDDIFCNPKIENPEPPFYDIIGKAKYKKIESLEDELKDALCDVRCTIKDLKWNLLQAERRSRSMLRKTYDYNLMLKKGEGSKKNFWGSEKSDSPLSKAKEEMEKTYEEIADRLTTISKDYDTLINKHVLVTKLYAKLYKLTKDPKLASAPGLDQIKGTGLDIAKNIYSKGSFKNNSLSLGLKTLGGVDKREKFLSKVTDEELKNLFDIKFDLKVSKVK